MISVPRKPCIREHLPGFGPACRHGRTWRDGVHLLFGFAFGFSRILPYVPTSPVELGREP